MLKAFIDRTTKPVLIVGGAGTALAGLDALAPRFAVENVQKIDFIPAYTIFVQHWGMMVGLFGVFMVAAAFKESWREPVLLYGMIEKAFMVFLFVVNRGQPHAEGFMAPAVMDGIITVWCILYFVSMSKKELVTAQG